LQEAPGIGGESPPVAPPKKQAKKIGHTRFYFGNQSITKPYSKHPNKFSFSNEILLLTC
jgi:hypothetical protein